MSIATGNIITAKDVQEKILGDITNICSRIDGGSFLADTLPNNIRNIVNKPYLSNFLSSFNLLKEHIGNLSTFFGVTRGHLIELSGFYDYVASCYSEASDIRHAMYHVLTQNYQWNEVDSVSYLNDFPDNVYLKNTPLLSSKIIAPHGPMTVGSQTRISCSDFRFNFSETGQGVSSTMDEYNKYSSLSVGNLIDYSNFNNQSKQMYITQIVSANHANNLFGILDLLNEEIGNILSCEYWWLGSDGKARKPFTFNVKYYSNPNADHLLCHDTVQEFTNYTVRTWKNVNPSSQSQILYWVNFMKPSRTFAEGSKFRVKANSDPFFNQDTLKLVPKVGYDKFELSMFNVEDTDLGEKIKHDKTIYFKFNSSSNTIGNDTHYVNGFKVVDGAGLTATSSPDSETLTISGFPEGTKYITFNKVALWCNELVNTHRFSIFMVDVNDNNSEKTLLIYGGKWNLPYYQRKISGLTYQQSPYSKYLRDSHDAIYQMIIASNFPNSSYAGGEAVSLKVVGGNVRFRIKYVYRERDGGRVGAREVYFCPLELDNGQIIDGGIQGITLH